MTMVIEMIEVAIYYVRIFNSDCLVAERSGAERSVESDNTGMVAVLAFHCLILDPTLICYSLVQPNTK